MTTSHKSKENNVLWAYYYIAVCVIVIGIVTLAVKVHWAFGLIMLLVNFKTPKS